MEHPVSLSQIVAARQRIAHVAMQTPILSVRSMSTELGNEIFLKGEHLQKTGSFKIRGAANKVLQEAARGTRHVVVASSGNHGQAVAYIANVLGLQATIVVPEDAAACKTQAIAAYNGQVERCGTTSDERMDRARQICLEQGAVYVPPYDDYEIIAGQATVGLELLEQLDGIDEVYVPVGGGGLLSGVAAAIKQSRPEIRVIGVEPQLANDTYLSLQQGKRINIGGTRTIADGLRTSVPGELTFPLIRQYVDEVMLVTEEEIKSAFTLVFSRMKQVVEPSGAVAVAAVLAQPAQGKRMVAVVSGGNVDTALIPSLLQ